MQEHGYYIYLLQEKTTNNILYVGRTKFPMRRFQEHKKAIKTSSAPLYKYIRENDLKLYDDINVIITEFIPNDEIVANEREQYYTDLYKDTVLNVYLGDKRDFEYSNLNKPIQCITDGKIYSSIKQVFETYTGVTNLYSHLQYGTRLKNGLVFRYVDGVDNSDKVWKIECLDDGQRFSSLKACAEFYNISAQILYHKGADGKPFTVGTAGRGNKKCHKLNFKKFVN